MTNNGEFGQIGAFFVGAFVERRCGKPSGLDEAIQGQVFCAVGGCDCHARRCPASTMRQCHLAWSFDRQALDSDWCLSVIVNTEVQDEFVVLKEIVAAAQLDDGFLATISKPVAHLPAAKHYCGYTARNCGEDLQRVELSQPFHGLDLLMGTERLQPEVAE